MLVNYIIPLVSTKTWRRRSEHRWVRVYASLRDYLLVATVTFITGAGHPGEDDIGGLVLVRVTDLWLANEE